MNTDPKYIDRTAAYKLIIFDWDGTLMDSQERIVNCLSAAAADLVLPELHPSVLKNIIGLGLNEAILSLYPGLDTQQVQAFADRYRYHFLTADDTPMGVFENVHNMLQVLIDHGFLLAIATGKARRGLNQVLQETQLGELFQGSRCADETRSKPHPQMLLELLDEFGLTSEEAIMVGDTEYDMIMANSINMDGLAVSYGVHEKEALLKHNPLDCVDTIDELFHWLTHCQSAW
jgi:phosphoglycolate phosphatase